TVFGYSSSCDPTILTGTMPRAHGHFTFFRFAPDASPFRSLTPLWRALSWLPASLTNRGRLRRYLSRFVGRWLGVTGYFQLYAAPFARLPLFDYTERRDLYQPGGINGGQLTIFDRLRADHVPFFCSNWRQNDAANFADMHAALATGTPQFAYLFLGALDAVLHRDGTAASSVGNTIANYDTELRRLLATARAQYDDVSLMVFSDHGMTDITSTCDLQAAIDALGLVYGTDYGAIYDSTMARFWFLNDVARTRITAVLQQTPAGRVLSDDDLARYECDFPARQYGELFFLLHPGVLMLPSDLGRSPLAGMHGFAPEDADSTAFFGATDACARAPQRLADLHDLMLASVRRQRAHRAA
ncbi:MAG: alkaline phosphatase family protein, partial [Acidobacteriota bacterium]